MTVLYGAKITGLRELRQERLAFASQRDGNSEIYTCNSDGSAQTRVTNNASSDLVPSFSPDGRKIAFNTFRDGNSEIYTMNADGSGLLRLTNNATNDFEPAWSPDGTRIAFSATRDGNQEIYVMNANGTSQTRLTNNAVTDFIPSWSPDGRSIAFASNRDGNYEIYIMNADGTLQTRLTNNASDDSHPSWSPDGQLIAFHSSRDGNYEIYTMYTDGSSPTRMTNSPGIQDAEPVWSPDGSRIALTRLAGGVSEDIYLLRLGDRLPTRVITNADVDYFADWSRGPAIFRTLIGAAGSDGGANPPFGTQRVLTVVGLKAHDGVVSAMILAVADGTTVQAAPLPGGNSLIGLKITASSINSLVEDTGRGRPLLPWAVNSPPSGAVLVYFDADTGRIDTVIASSDAAIASAASSGDIQTQAGGGRLTLRGRFTAAHDARDPQANLVAKSAQEIVLDSRTGQVLAVQ